MTNTYDPTDPGPTPPAGDDTDDTPPPKKTAATQLVELALERYDLGVSDTGKAYAVDKYGSNVALNLRGGIGPKLAHAYYQKHSKTVSNAAKADALSVIEGEALQENATDLPLRVGRDDRGRIILDLGGIDGHAVELRPDRWELIDRSPITFRRTDLTNALPIPSDSGDAQNLDFLRDSINVTERDWPLVVGWLVAALIPEIPHPVLALFGEQGTGKSTAGKFLGQVIDPTGAPLRSAPRNEDAWATSASGSWVVVLDNLSGVPPWLSDALCKAVTGDGIVKRRLYSDNEVEVIRFRRCIVMTSIDAGALRGDLAERLLPVELDRIDPTERRTEAVVEALFQSNHARILGGLLDLTAKVLEVLPSVELEEMPRMADFARILAAVDKVTDFNSLDSFLNIGATLAEDVIESDVVASAVARLLTEEEEWSGTSQELLLRLTPKEGMLPRGWPTTATKLSGQVKRAAPALRSLGFVVGQGTGRAQRTWFMKMSGVGQTASPASQASRDESAGDAGDARNGHFRTPDISTSEPVGLELGLDLEATAPAGALCNDCHKRPRGSFSALCVNCSSTAANTDNTNEEPF